MARFAGLSALIVCVLGIVATSACGQEMIDSPAYQSWASHKPGTKVTQESQVSAEGMTMTHQITQTLLEVTADKVVIEVGMSMDMGGMKHQMKRKQEIAAKVAKGQENLPPDVKGSFKDLGQETVEISGKSYTCRVGQFTGESDQGKVSGKVWTCGEIPGHMARMEMKMESPEQVTTTMKVMEIELK